MCRLMKKLQYLQRCTPQKLEKYFLITFVTCGKEGKYCRNCYYKNTNSETHIGEIFFLLTSQ